MDMTELCCVRRVSHIMEKRIVYLYSLKEDFGLRDVYNCQ